MGSRGRRRRRRRRPRNRGTAPLYWADQPSSLLEALHARARAAVPLTGRARSDLPIAEARPGWARRVQAEFYRLLDAERIYVEGHTDLARPIPGRTRRGA